MNRGGRPLVRTKGKVPVVIKLPVEDYEELCRLLGEPPSLAGSKSSTETSEKMQEKLLQLWRTKWESLPAEIRRACGEEPDSAQPENETEDPHFHAPRFWAPEFD